MKKPKSIFERLAKKWQNDELEYYLDMSKSKDFYEFKLPPSTSTAFQVEEHDIPNDKHSKSKISQDEKGNYIVEIDNSIEPTLTRLSRLFSDYNIPPKSIDIGIVTLHKSAKITDFISGDHLSGNGWILNEKVKDIFSNFNIGKHRYYPINVVHTDKEYDNYFYLQFSNDASEHVDFTKSKFYMNKSILDLADTREDIEINSKEEIDKKTKELKKTDKWCSISPKIIKLSEKFPNYDLIEFHSLNTISKFISERLFSELKNKEVSGYEALRTSKIEI